MGKAEIRCGMDLARLLHTHLIINLRLAVSLQGCGQALFLFHSHCKTDGLLGVGR